MKKVLSILMSILIIALSLTFVAGAATGKCEACGSKEHKAENCYCCIDCENLDIHHITSCIKDAERLENGEYDLNARCCTSCTGIIPCSCGCSCCSLSESDKDTGKEIFTEEQQEGIIDAFQSVLGRVREFFDKLFNTIFEFLRFDEIMGNN